MSAAQQSFTAICATAMPSSSSRWGVATYYDERVPESITSNDTPIRSAVLLALAEQDVDAISTPAGKRELQKTLKSAVNDVLVAKTGFGGVDDVYFTSFIIQ
jgi:flagellar FliL protein